MADDPPSPADRQLIADATDRTLQRLKAWLSGDQLAVAQIDATAPTDPRSLAAMSSVAFGIAGHSLSVIRARGGEREMQDVLQSFQDQVDEYRQQ